MVKQLPCYLSTAAFLFLAWTGSVLAAENSYVEGEVLVKYKPQEVDITTRQGRVEAIRFEKQHDLRRVGEIKEENIRLLESENSTTETIAEISRQEEVSIAEPNFKRELLLAPNDTYFHRQWGLHNTGQTINGLSGANDADVDAPEAWDGVDESGLHDIIVAVIDTGVRFDHQDLAANMWNGASCKDDLGNVIVGGCPYHGWDYGQNDNNPMDASPSQGHGSHVAGIIGAVSGNGLGVAGTNYHNRVKIMAVRFGFTTFSEIKAINFARHNGAKVINASYGGYDYSQIEKQTIEAFPGLMIAAAGNGGADQQGDNNDNAPLYPCSYDSANVVCVAATEQQDALTAYSNYSQNSVDLAAPGNNILSTYATAINDYAYMSGTSMATPFVAGAAASLLSQDNSLSSQRLKNILLYSGDRLGSLVSKIKTEKRLNLQQAVAAISDTDAPTLSNGAPTEVIATQNEPIYLSAQTDEPALCKYSTLNVQFDAMTTYFSNTGQTSHTSLLDNLAPANEYTYYVRCRDRSGNEANEAFSISFSTDPSFVRYAAPAVTPLSTAVYNNNAALQAGAKNVVHKRYKRRLRLTGATSSHLASGSVKIFQGRKSYVLKRHVPIAADGLWNSIYRSKKSGSLIKFVYYNTAGQEVKTDGPYYMYVR